METQSKARDMPAERKSNAKLNEIRNIELQMQEKWCTEKTFEEDAPGAGSKEAKYKIFTRELSNDHD